MKIWKKRKILAILIYQKFRQIGFGGITVDGKEVYFGYSREEILNNFRRSEWLPNLDERIGKTITLSQLADVSKTLLSENAKFLKSIYGAALD